MSHRHGVAVTRAARTHADDKCARAHTHTRAHEEEEDISIIPA